MEDKSEILVMNLRKLYEQYGYKKISLPTFEEYDLYSEYRDFIKSEKTIIFLLLVVTFFNTGETIELFSKSKP